MKKLIMGTISLMIVIAISSCGTKESPDFVRTSQIVRYLDSIGDWNHRERGTSFWTRSHRVLKLSDESFLEFSLIQSVDQYDILSSQHNWGIAISHVWVKEGRCYITTFADGDVNGEPDVVTEEEITSFQYKSAESLLDYYDPYVGNKEKRETIPPAKFETLPAEEQKEFQLSYSVILTTMKEKIQLAEKPKWE